jgi:hypothetical protein
VTVVVDLPEGWLAAARAAASTLVYTRTPIPEFVDVAGALLYPTMADVLMPGIWQAVADPDAGGLEVAHIAWCPPGSRVPRHVDRSGEQVGRLAAVSALIEDSFSGGELVVDGETVPLAAGQAAVWPLQLPHEVAPVVDGTRVVLVSRVVNAFAVERSPFLTWTPNHAPGDPYRFPRPATPSELEQWAAEGAAVHVTPASDRKGDGSG